MAVTRISPALEPWAVPTWPPDLADPGESRVLYNPLVDELVVFLDSRRRGGVVVWIEPPSEDIAVIADDERGEVIGVQVDTLLFKAISVFPSWRALAEPEPPPRSSPTCSPRRSGGSNGTGRGRRRRRPVDTNAAAAGCTRGWAPRR